MKFEAKPDAAVDSFEHRRAFDRRGAAKYLREAWGLRVRVSSLPKKAVYGTGTRFFKPSASTCVYMRSDLDAWARERLGEPIRSTAEWERRQRRESGDGHAA